MLSPKTLRRPGNWQDFETLCKKLWGEIWNCPEIKKNGRSGQKQNGVDVYGIPANEIKYYGIQCKGREEYADKQFTEKEILEEIQKAKDFKPALKKLYLATTALKDVKVEEYVRILNIDHIQNGLFEVHLYSWEDIVELIDENKQTHDWYLKNQGFKTHQEIKITLQNDSNEISLKPKFQQEKKIYRIAAAELSTVRNPALDAIMKNHQNLATLGAAMNPVRIYSRERKNLSLPSFQIKIHNTGTEPIEEYKVLFEIEGDILQVAETNYSNSYSTFLFSPNRTTFIERETKSGSIIPRNKILVGDDRFKSAEIYLKCKPEKQLIKVHCKLISKSYQTSETLLITIDPEIKINRKFIAVEDPEEEKTELGPIEDYLSEE